MIQRKPNGNGKLILHGFLVGIELEEGESSPEQVSMRIQDALTFVDGVGTTDVSYLGIVDLAEEPKE